jgi:hypothetical protein
MLGTWSGKFTTASDELVDVDVGGSESRGFEARHPPHDESSEFGTACTLNVRNALLVATGIDAFRWLLGLTASGQCNALPKAISLPSAACRPLGRERRCPDAPYCVIFGKFDLLDHDAPTPVVVRRILAVRGVVHGDDSPNLEEW